MLILPDELWSNLFYLSEKIDPEMSIIKTRIEDELRNILVTSLHKFDKKIYLNNKLVKCNIEIYLSVSAEDNMLICTFLILYKPEMQHIF